MSDRFTVVFKGDIRAFDGNPLHIVSPFGEVAACGEGDAFEAADTIEALRAENARLRETAEAHINGWAKQCEITTSAIKERDVLKAVIQFILDNVQSEGRREGVDSVIVHGEPIRAARAAMGESDG